MTATKTTREPVEEARRLAPRIAERAAETERLRGIPDETIAELRDSGLIHVFKPSQYGGAESDLLAGCAAFFEISKACASTGWVLGVIAVHDWNLALFPPQAQDDVWGAGEDVLISSAYAPTGKVEPADGGYRISGQWPFSSGSEHCTWAILGGVVEGADGVPQLLTLLVPRSDYEIRDVWYALGLAGTGSNTIEIEDAFVPAHRVLDSLATPAPGHTVNSGPLYRVPFGTMLPWVTSGPGVAAASAAYEHTRMYLRNKVSVVSGQVSLDPFVQRHLVEGRDHAEMAHRLWFGNLERVRDVIYGGGELTIEERARISYDHTVAVQHALDAALHLFDASGSAAVMLTQPVQRALRDVLAIRAHHANNHDRAIERGARPELGLPTTTLFV
jgi:3-hydroxy-9,10-secoandrosta-1,3,5(10)-triene-9,17-dione monooxygenase